MALSRNASRRHRVIICRYYLAFISDILPFKMRWGDLKEFCEVTLRVSLPNEGRTYVDNILKALEEEPAGAFNGAVQWFGEYGKDNTFYVVQGLIMGVAAARLSHVNPELLRHILDSKEVAFVKNRVDGLKRVPKKDKDVDPSMH